MPTWFADLPAASPIDLSRQGLRDVGSSKAEDRTPPCLEQGFKMLGDTARWGNKNRMCRTYVRHMRFLFFVNSLGEKGKNTLLGRHKYKVKYIH